MSVLHHSNSFRGMIEAFSVPEIMSETLKVRRLLRDSGSGGVRDVYSSFWTEWYQHVVWKQGADILLSQLNNVLRGKLYYFVNMW